MYIAGYPVGSLQTAVQQCSAIVAEVVAGFFFAIAALPVAAKSQALVDFASSSVPCSAAESLKSSPNRSSIPAAVAAAALELTLIKASAIEDNHGRPVIQVANMPQMTHRHREHAIHDKQSSAYKHRRSLVTLDIHG
eukprot:18802-Heterococcus_DN1.PRE.3